MNHRNLKTKRHFAFVILLSLLTCNAFADKISYTDTIALNNHDTTFGYQQLDSNIAGKSIFIAGENHTYLESNSKLWVQNIKYLYKNAGVRNVLTEGGPAMAWLTNEYIQTGDSSLFAVIKKYVFEEYADKYEKLREFNVTLDSNDRITLYGIDLERGTYGAMKVLSMLIPDSVSAPDSIDIHIEGVLGMAMYQDREIFKRDEKEDDDEEDYLYGYSYSVSGTINLLLDNFERHDTLYEAYLGDKYDLFKEILMSLKNARYWNRLERNNTAQGYVYREKYMYQQFLSIYNEKGGKYYGQFGRCHATKKKADKNSCEWYVFKSLANRMKQSKELNLKNQIMTFGIMYKDDNDYLADDWEIVGSEIDALFDSLGENTVLLYDLASDSSLSAFFEEDFDYLFLNTYSPSKDHPYFDPTDFLEDYGTPFYVLAYRYGQTYINLESIGQLHDADNQDVFASSNPLIYHGGIFRTGNKTYSNWVSSTYMGATQAINSVNTDGRGQSESKLTSFAYNSEVLYDLVGGLNFLDVYLGGALGFSNLRLAVTETNDNLNLPISSGFVGGMKQSIFNNPAFTGSILFGIDINMGPVTIGCNVGSQYDFSKPEWRLGGELLKDGPQTSFTALMAGVHAGFNFK